MNRWAEVVDIDVLRRLFENALVPRRAKLGAYHTDRNVFGILTLENSLAYIIYSCKCYIHRLPIQPCVLLGVVRESDGNGGSHFWDNVANEFTPSYTH